MTDAKLVVSIFLSLFVGGVLGLAIMGAVFISDNQEIEDWLVRVFGWSTMVIGYSILMRSIWRE